VDVDQRPVAEVAREHLERWRARSIRP
jgi:hypothetical protein